MFERMWAALLGETSRRRDIQVPDLRGTGETGASLAYNRACFALRREVPECLLREWGWRTILATPAREG